MYFVNKYEISRYISNALQSFKPLWDELKTTDRYWDYRQFATEQLRTFGLFTEWKPARGRPPKIPYKYHYDTVDISVIYFADKKSVYNFRKQFGKNTKQIAVKSDKMWEAIEWLSNNVGHRIRDVNGAMIGADWDLAYDDEADNTDVVFQGTRDFFIDDAEKAFEFALRFGVAI